MANETLSFSCPACGSQLTVPASLAGVIGPCPTCRTQIQAPIPAPVVQVPAPVAPQQIAVGPSGYPAQAPAYPSQAPVYPSQVPQHAAYVAPAAPAPTYPTPASQAHAPAAYPATSIPQPRAQQTPPYQGSSNPAVLRPEPRQLPNRQAPVEVVAKQMPEPVQVSDSKRPSAAPLPRHPHRTSPLARIAILIPSLLASMGLVYGVLTILKNQTERESRLQDPPPQAEKPPQEPATTPAPAEAADDKEPEPFQAQVLPTPASEQPNLIEPPPPLPEGMPPKAPAMEALAVLEKFLSAKTLAERLSIIETKLPESELATTCLSGPLPATRNVVIDAQESNPVESVVDFFYNVDFELGENRLNPQTVLVRSRGGGQPKVVVEPFLDLYGGRLAAFASAPSEKGGNFQVIIYPIPSCSDPNIREREKKLTLKLLARENTKEIAQAYFSKSSKIGEMLVDGTYDLSYGKPKPCTVMLRWNTEENKDHPYLEASDIIALDWNP